jgi:ribonuclease HI
VIYALLLPSFHIRNNKIMFGYVFYPDGGCYPQHEYSGAGVHGYRWNLGLTARGIGHNSHSATFHGYVPKSESFDFANKEAKAEVNGLPREQFQDWAKEEKDGKKNIDYRVPVERYYDAFIPMEFGGTNNTAELNAAIHCLERIAAEPDFKDAGMVVIRQDSRYVVDGHNVYLQNWLDKDFTRRDGTKVSNPDLWKRFNTIASMIKAQGVYLNFEWVKGHGACIGNNAADELATAARIISKNPKECEQLDDSFRISEVTDYWASKSDMRHPMLCQRFLYTAVDNTAQGDRREYCLSTQGKVAELNGKRTSDDGFSVIRIAPQRHIEDIVTKQMSLPREIDYKFQVDLDSVYGSDTRYLDLYGVDFLHRALDHKRHLQTYGKVMVTQELHPPFLVDRMFDTTDILADFLDHYKDTSQQVTLHTRDITADFFDVKDEEVKVKKGEEPQTKRVTTIKPEIAVGYFKHKTLAHWKEQDGEIKECEITLRLGIDLPDRNALRRIGDRNPTVYLLTNRIGPGAFMYAVVIEAGDDAGIWSGVHSSLRVTAKPPVKEKAEKKAA